MLAIRRTNPQVKLFTDLFDDLFEINSIIPSTKDTFVPIHDIIENDNEFVVDMMLAGVKKEDTAIEVDDDLLTITAERKEVKDLKYNRKESFTGIYKRSFKLPETVDKENIIASFTDGVLTVTIPKKEPLKLEKKMIEIK
jgi:HSP20 family protein